MPAIYAEYPAVAGQGDEAQRAAPRTETAKTVRDQGRRDARHRRAVRRDEGEARRLLPRRGRLDRGGARSWRRRSRPRGSAARSRCARSWRCSDAVHAAHLQRGRGLGDAARAPSARRSTRSTRSSAATCAAQGSCSPARSSSRSRPRRPCRCAAATPSSPTAPSPRRRRRSEASTSIEADSLDEAIEWARAHPLARHGTIEVRPVVDHSGNGA